MPWNFQNQGTGYVRQIYLRLMWFFLSLRFYILHLKVFWIDFRVVSRPHVVIATVFSLFFRREVPFSVPSASVCPLRLCVGLLWYLQWIGIMLFPLLGSCFSLDFQVFWLLYLVYWNKLDSLVFYVCLVLSLKPYHSKNSDRYSRYDNHSLCIFVYLLNLNLVLLCECFVPMCISLF